MMGAARDYIDAVKAAIESKFSSAPNVVRTVSHLLETDGTKVDTPAVLIDVEDIADGVDAGDERLPVTFTISLYCVLGGQTPSPEIEIREFALAVMQLAMRNRWGLTGISAPRRLHASPAAFAPVKPGHHVWVVSFEQDLDVGDSVWDVQLTGLPPGEVFISLSPEIGLAHIDDYTRIVPAADSAP